jgi:basic membrane protein A
MAAACMGGVFVTAGGQKAAAAGASSQLKIALLMPGPINDGGWNTMAYTALKEAEQFFTAEVAYTENVKQNDQVQLLRQYATRGYNVLIGHGFEFGDAMNQVGGEFPDKYFINYGGAAQNGKNVASVNYAYGQTGALMGVLAGMQKDVTKVGVILAFEQPTSQQELFNVERFAKQYNPAIQFAYTYTGDWDDIAKGKEAAIAHLNNGCQLIVNDLSGPAGAIIQAVEERNAKYIQSTFDAYDMCPAHILSSAVHDATKATLTALQAVKDGTFKGVLYKYGLKEGVMSVGRYGPAVTPEMKAEVEKVKQDIVDGKAELTILLAD